MKIIIGLGNPGNQYQQTRHNLGMAVVSQFAKKTTNDFDWTAFSFKKKLNALVSEGQRDRDKYLLILPQTLMNNSGESLKPLIKLNQVAGQDLLVIHDDLDLPLGKIKLDFNRGAAGHLGVQSLIDALGAKEFWRLRCGIGDNRTKNLPAEKN